MKKYTVVLIVLVLLFVTSCASRQDTNAKKGSVTGAAAGAMIGQAIGGDTESTLLGATIGSLLGYAIGQEMDRRDREQLNNTYERGVSGQTVTWVNPDTGVEYEVTPKPAQTYKNGDQVCRPAQVEITVDGKREKTTTTACRNQYGQWVLQQVELPTLLQHVIGLK